MPQSFLCLLLLLANGRILDRVEFDAVDYLQEFFFSSCDPAGFVLLNASRRDFCDIANDLIIWKLNSFSMSKHFPCSQLLNLVFPFHKMKLSIVKK